MKSREKAVRVEITRGGVWVRVKIGEGGGEDGYMAGGVG